MTRLLIKLFIGVLLLWAHPAFAQDYPMVHYTVEDGLPSNTVYSIYRDSKGFLWIATDKGIARYNGIRFETFTTFDGLPNNEIFFFKEDLYGRLWLGTYSGDLCYYKDDTFHTAKNTPFLKLPAKYAFISGIAVEKDSSVIIHFNDRSKFININHEKCKVFDLTKIIANRSYNPIHLLFIQKESENEYKFYCIDKTFLIDTFLNIKQLKNMNYYKNNSLEYKMWRLTDCQDQIFIHNDDYIFDQNFNLIRKFNYNLFKKCFLYEMYSKGNNFFITTDQGIFLNDSIQMLSGNKISYITQDVVGNYWAASLESGIFVLSKYITTSNLLTNTYKGRVDYLFSDKKRIFFTTTKHHINLLQNNHVNLIKDYNEYAPQNYYSVSSGFLIDSNYSFYNIHNLVTIYIKNITLKNPSVKTYKTDIHISYSIRNIFKIADKLLINGTNSIFNLDINQFATNKLHCSKMQDSLQSDRGFCMAKAPDNSIWYSTIKNMRRIDGEHIVIQPQFKGLIFKSFFFLNKYLIGYTHDNQLLICSNYGGNIVVDSVLSQNCIWENFYPIDSVHAIISTNKLYRLLTTYSTASKEKYSIWPLENQFIPLQAEAISSDGDRCYFFKNGSITAIDLHSLIKKPDPPKLFFNSIKAGKMSYKVNSNIEIPYDQSNDITVLFSVLSFSSKNTSYQFCTVAKGYPEVWRDVTGDALNLFNLGYGYHIIKLRAKSLSSDYSQPISFSLYITRPFWATWWFATTCVVLFILLLVLVTRIRIRYIIRKNEKAHATEVKFMKSEYKALNALMNPHFIFNTLNNVQSLVNDNNKLAANEYLRVFADLIRQNMHNISKELIPLQKEMDLVSNYLALEKLRFEDKLTYFIHVDENVDLSDTMVPPLLIQPLVENSIKHGILTQKNDEGIISINIYQQHGIMYIEIKDNGSGITGSQNKKSPLHESFGLENIKTRIQQLSIIQGKEITFSMNELKDAEGNAAGTLVTISMPVA